MRSLPELALRFDERWHVEMRIKHSLSKPKQATDSRLCCGVKPTQAESEAFCLVRPPQ